MLILTPEELTVKNFGPIARGELKFQDFTIICGAHNTGKTYLALLTCALVEASYEILHSIPFIIAELLKERKGTGCYDGDYVRSIMSGEKVYDDVSEKVRLRESLYLFYISGLIERNLGLPLKSLVGSYGDKLEVRFKSRLKVLFEGVFNDFTPPSLTEVSSAITLELAVTRDGESKLSLSIDPKIIDIACSSIDSICITDTGWNIKHKSWWVFPIDKFIYIPAERIGLFTSILLPMILLTNIATTLIVTLGKIAQTISEISRWLTGAVSRHYMVSIGRVSIQEFIRKVMDTLQRIDSETELTISPIGGRLRIEKPSREVPGVLYYEDDVHGVNIPIICASSGIIQLAPIALLLNNVKNMFVVVEEPEINLHPDAQLRVAEWLTEFYKRGNVLTYLITTHSPFLLTKLVHLHAKGIIKNISIYLIQSNGEIRKLEIKGPEVELPETMTSVYDELAREALELSGLKTNSFKISEEEEK
ncbi:MAG: ATP-binding protein [Crenarchaeota archaeon]|nr:ATP-binding protein [Thermoproteota archaeon]